MASVSNAGNNNSTSSSATLTVSVTAAIGNWLVLMCAADNNGTNGATSLSTSVTDAAGNTWINRGGLINQDPGSAAAGATFSMWTCKVTAALSAQNITINFSPNTTSKGAICYRVQPGTDEVLDFVQVGAGGNGNGSTQTGASAISVTDGDIIFGGSAVEANATVTGDGDSTNGSWSTIYQGIANSGSSNSSMTCSAQWKQVNATGNQTWATTTSGSQDWAANYLILRVISQPSDPTFSFLDQTEKSSELLLSADALSCTIVSGPSTNFSKNRSRHGTAVRKFYFETTLTNIADFGNRGAGIGNSSVAWSTPDTNYIGINNNGCGYYPNQGIYLNGSLAVSWNASGANGGVICIAVDATARLFWARYNNGNWNNNGAANPATGANGVNIAAITGTLYAGVQLTSTGEIISPNFGSAAWAFTPPAGFGEIAFEFPHGVVQENRVFSKHRPSIAAQRSYSR